MKQTKIALFVLAVFFFGASAAVEAQTARKPAQKTTAKTDSPDASMQKFVRALMTSDRTVFLSFLSQKTSLKWRNFQAVGDEPTFISYKKMAEDFRRKDDHYYTFLARGENGELDCFADNATQSDGKKWKKHGANIFYPPDRDEFSENGDYVRWKKENGKWVIVEISYNTA